MARADLKYIIGFETNDTPVVQATKRLNMLQKEVKYLSDQQKAGNISAGIMRKGQKQLNDEILRLRTATKEGGKALDQYINKVNSSGKAMRRKEIAAQQAGYQLQDFIVQIQAGQNPVIAFTQQFSQLAGFFAGPWGAAIGLGIAVLGGLVTALWNTGEQAEDTAEKVKTAMDNMMSSFTDAQTALSSARTGFSPEFIKARIALQSDVDLLAQKMMELQSNPQEGDRNYNTGWQNINKDIQEEIDTLQKQIDSKNSALRALEQATNRATAQADAIEQGKKDAAQLEKDQIANAKKRADFILKTITAIKKAQAENKKWYDTQGKAYDLQKITVGLTGRELLLAQQKVAFIKLTNDLRERGIDPLKNEGLQLVMNLRSLQGQALAAFDKAEATKKQEDLDRKRLVLLKQLTPLEKQMNDLAKSLENNMTNAFMSMVDGTMSVKDAFKSMAASIIKDLYKVYVLKKLIGGYSTSVGTGGERIVESSGIVGAIGNALNGGKANGGPVAAGGSYLVGERGPEIFTPGIGGGTITPNSQSGLGGVTIVQNINVSTGVQQTVRAEIRQMMPQIAQSAKNAVVDSKRRGGNYGRAMA
jgi:hypothetical protein